MIINYQNKEWTILYNRPFPDDKKSLEICLVDSEGNEIEPGDLPTNLKMKVYTMAFNAAEDDDWGRELAHGDFLADCLRDSSWQKETT